MDNQFSTYKPEGFDTVTPYLFVDEPHKLIDFLKTTFLPMRLIDP